MQRGPRRKKRSPSLGPSHREMALAFEEKPPEPGSVRWELAYPLHLGPRRTRKGRKGSEGCAHRGSRLRAALLVGKHAVVGFGIVFRIHELVWW